MEFGLKDLNNLAWIDLEMTGLDPQKDVILEIAAIVTDADLNIIAESNDIIIFQPDEKLADLNEWVFTTHTASGLLEQVRHSTISLEQAEQDIVEFFKRYCVAGVTPLCGNSIWQDRRFLMNYMPLLHNFFHYRMIDVSTIKELVKRWYDYTYTKPDTHRALVDIRASIEELKLYREKFFVTK